MFSHDEMWGIIGQLEGLRQDVQRGQDAFRAVIQGQFMQPGEPDISDINAMKDALLGAKDILKRIDAEGRDPDSAFGGGIDG